MPITLNAVPPGMPMLIGRLVVHRRGPIRYRPVLSVESWCPCCRRTHAIPWPDESRPDHVEITPTPCPSGPWAGREVAIGLDPGREMDHRRILRDFAASLRRWRIEARLRHLTAVSRSRERVYAREWPDAAREASPAIA